MWDISPTLVRYDTVEAPSKEIAQLGFADLAKRLKGSKTASGEKFELPVKNFYMTDVVSRRLVFRPPCFDRERTDK